MWYKYINTPEGKVQWEFILGNCSLILIICYNDNNRELV